MSAKGTAGALDLGLYEAMFDLAQAIPGQPDLESFRTALAPSLHRIISFDSLDFLVYDPVSNELQSHFSTGRENGRNALPVPADGSSVAASVWRKQKRVVLSALDEAAQKDSSIGNLFKEGVRTIAVVPFSNRERRLGVLVFGFNESYQEDDPILTSVQLVASKFAVVVDGFLSRLRLEQESKRMRVVFEITSALISKLPMPELFSAMSQQLWGVVSHDLAFILLLDPSRDAFHVTALHSPSGLETPSELPCGQIEGLPLAEALKTGKPVIANLDYDRFPSPIYRRAVDIGVRISCTIPLIGANRTLGGLVLGRTNGPVFNNDDIELLVQVGRQVALALENALSFGELADIKEKLTAEKRYLEEEIRLDQNVNGMIGESAAFREVIKALRIVAPTDATVLVQGETGTGKELVARAIHDFSERSKQSFIKVNCAAIPATLLESELFGHEKGSFTGAFAQKIGRFELAHKGTLFLDEIGEIPLELQSKLLRAIQEHELERLGGNRTIHVDVRLVAATNRNLSQMIEEGKFRGDLYYRLHVFPLTVPPLRERREDIPLLIRYFTQAYAKRMNRPIEEIPSASIEALTAYDWPGNIRELQNIIERSVILSSGHVLEVRFPQPAKPGAQLAQTGRSRINDSVERERILQALRESGGKVAGSGGAAARLGVLRTTLQSRMKRLHIERQYR
jgi:formate hydrogenlyase transcriptional activator